MKIAIGSDHRGVDAVKALIAHLQARGHQVSLMHECSGNSCDYPDAAYRVGTAVASGRADAGILVCSNGVGMCIAANKVHGVRAALVYDQMNAERSRAHNHANVACFGGDTNSAEDLIKIAETWLSTPYEGGRHQRRVNKIMAIEAGQDPTSIPIVETPSPTAARA